MNPLASSGTSVEKYRVWCGSGKEDQKYGDREKQSMEGIQGFNDGKDSTLLQNW